MKTAKEYAYEYFAPDAPDELDIDIIKCIITDHDNELISEIEKKIKERIGEQITEEEFAQKKLIKMDKLLGDVKAQIEIGALTEIINLIKEK